MSYIHFGLPILSKTAYKAFSVSAHNIQAALLAKNGRQYSIQDINDVLAQWLESSIEQLTEEACELCVTGDRNYSAFNRQTFSDLLKKVPSADIWEQTAEVSQLFQDQNALSLERVA